MNKTEISIVLPVYNEAGNIKELVQRLAKTLSETGKNYEIIFIDDASTDGSCGIMKEAAKTDSRIKIIRFAKNFGQTAAISAGFNNARGEVIIPMDADLQNAPEDIPKFLEKLEEGYDVVAGWRKNRKDKYLTKTLPSKIANKIISKITKIKLHDYGCTMKAYRKEVLKGLALYGEMHRLIPAYTAWHGARVAEIETSHQPRKAGKTKYSVFKTMRVILDIITVKFLSSYLSRPMHFFGGIGFISVFLGIISGAFAIYLKFAAGLNLTRNPLLLFSAVLIIVGTMFILMGILAEVMTRIYYESQKKESYLIKEKINLD